MITYTCHMPDGHGVLAHKTRCTRYEKYILNVFRNVKNFETKKLDVHQDILCLYTKFREKRNFLWLVEKRQKKRSHETNFGAPEIVFFTRPQKMSFSHEILCANLECPDVHQEILFRIF